MRSLTTAGWEAMPFGTHWFAKLPAESIYLIVVIVIAGDAEDRTAWFVGGDQSVSDEV